MSDVAGESLEEIDAFEQSERDLAHSSGEIESAVEAHELLLDFQEKAVAEDVFDNIVSEAGVFGVQSVFEMGRDEVEEYREEPEAVDEFGGPVEAP